jgi:hypothetical protein
VPNVLLYNASVRRTLCILLPFCHLKRLQHGMSRWKPLAIRCERSQPRILGRYDIWPLCRHPYMFQRSNLHDSYLHSIHLKPFHRRFSDDVRCVRPQRVATPTRMRVWVALQCLIHAPLMKPSVHILQVHP